MRQPRSRWTLIAGLSVLIIAITLSGPAGQSLSAPQIELDVPYGLNPSQKLDVYLPKGHAGKRRAVILIHGGGWVSGDKEDYRSIGRNDAALGVVAIAINYRLADGTPADMWPAQLEDAQTALSWVQANSKSFEIDENDICVSGNSAGGQLAIFLAALRQPDAAPIACVVDEFGPVDLTTFFQKAPAVLFGNHDLPTVRRLMEQASPINFVSHINVPTLIVQGTQDTVVRPDQSERLRAALSRAGVPTRYVSFSGGHGFVGLTGTEYLALQRLELDFIAHGDVGR